MSAADRRQRLLEVLRLRRHDTYDNLAREFNVCKRTIRYDVAALMCSYPLETVSGRYGGVRVASWYHLNRKTSAQASLKATPHNPPKNEVEDQAQPSEGKLP